MDTLIASSAGFFTFMNYVQFHPKIGNIWMRPDSTGSKKIQLEGLMPMIKAPLMYNHFWKSENLDINWLAYVIGFNGVYYLYRCM
tara:strand:- start:61 stop:315 length:255 start_codon:yes stop_codon:yes gene_type:complete